MTEQNSLKRGFIAVARREMRRWVSRPLYILCIVLLPLFGFLFFLTLMDEGLPRRLPAGVVDLDRSAASRNFVRQLNSFSETNIVLAADSYTEAREAVQAGEIYGFVVIPEGFEAKAMAGRRPTLTFYTNNIFFIPGALLFKDFKTMSVLASGAVVQQTLLAKGAYEYQMSPQLQPIVTDMHSLGNPWISYAIYLCNNFLPGMLQLMVLLVTVFSIGSEMKHRTSREWLHTGQGSIIIALSGKLMPQTVLFFIMGLFCQILLYGYWHFPLNNHFWHMALAMFLLVLASQSYAVIMMSFAPSLRIGLSIAGLFGIISFSITGFSFPTPAMYTPFQVLSNIFPLRHYFLIYADQALNGIPLYYSRVQYLALLLFAIASVPLLPRLKQALIKQVYVP
ncbi:MAG: ABC transporter permease [Bacteroidaceae bacterium]|nr:ABC transporter permease [Bacteroidaceae bacterium]